MERIRISLSAAIMLAALTGAGAAQESDGTWRADLAPLNTDASGAEAGGTATLTILDDKLTIAVNAEGTPPGIMHLQHFHGFAEGDEASHCPLPEADANGDGIIDVVETEPLAGTTMVPFHDNPVSMQIVADSYPVGADDGTYHYEKSISLAELRAAFSKAFPDQELDLERRVVFLHGVPEDSALPDGVQSIGDVPAHVTLPIACGELRRADN